MRYITVPADVMLRHPLTMEPFIDGATAGPLKFSFVKWAFTVWLNDPRAGASPLQLVRWANVVAAFTVAKAGDVIALEDQDYTVLRSIVEAPQGGYGPLVGLLLLPYSRAVLDAPDTQPTADANGTKELRS